MLFGACLDPFNFNVENENDFIVVDGIFTPTEGSHYVFVGHSVRFGQKINEAILGATVTIIDEDGARENYIERENGMHELMGLKVKGETGKSFHIEIELPNGKRIVSEPDIIPSQVKADSSYWKFSRRDLLTSTGIPFFQDVADIYINTSIPDLKEGENIYLRWSLEEVYMYSDLSCGPFEPALTCYIPLYPNIQEWTVFSSENYTAASVDSVLIFSKSLFNWDEFGVRHYFNVTQYSISEKSYKYWSKVQQLINQNGTIFDIPPATIKGNLSNPDNEDEIVLGYFELSAKHSALTSIGQGEYKTHIDPTHLCTFAAGTWTEFCCNCLLIPNAGVDKPDWIP